jgi:ZIP family zinc transporter
MIEVLARLSPTVQALAGTLFTWALTALGAAMVFFFKSIRPRVLNAMLGFASGVMIAASFWSLLNPAIALAESDGKTAWLVAAIGFAAGGAFLKIVDWLLPHVHSLGSAPEGIPTSWRRSVLLVLSITLHNIPEGLAVGVAFGGVAAGIPEASLAGAMALAFGMGMQNFPEGAAVSIPLRREGMSRGKAFWYGQLSGLVEPVAGVLGALLVVSMRSLLPYALAFAAGAMIYVVAEELIPTSQEDKGHSDLATVGVMLGFTLMMILDVALG